MTVMSTALSSAISIVWDREFGFLREMLVAPVSRTALVSGKTLGGASIATVQGTIMLALAPLIGVQLTWLVVVEVIGIELLMAVSLTAFGVFVASHIQRMEGFSVVMQLLLFPMLAAQHMPPAAAAKFSSSATLFGYTLSTAACIGITCAFAAAFLALAVTGFGKPD